MSNFEHRDTGQFISGNQDPSYYQELLADQPIMLSVKQYRTILGIGHTLASYHVKTGVVDSCLIGRRRLIFRDSVKCFLITQANMQNAANDNAPEVIS